MSRISKYMEAMLEVYGDKVELTKSTYDKRPYR
ncbi:hypothetical protein CLCOS_08900 [Clostridium coskatii]|uniref:Uncharacterized protein n=1 Tax=Clostridium coskatii TaxID=1705578 RepID=A0A162KVJ3_9CLOT|nr:hypothetical protein WX73_02734 [Clostridium coskatii]OBR96452.1 hypothetical protein CLCOS_08900 [Clostridium coskatii]